MKELILCAFVFYNIISSSTRLIQRSTEKPKGVPSDEDIKDMSSSREQIDGPEIVHFYKGKVRILRQDNQSNNLTLGRTKPQPKIPLVKKPIPKYKEMDSDEDYQSKQIKTNLRSKFVDSAEFEDQDFSVDDYDFDVNHDDFTGRGKPLEPRKDYKPIFGGRKPTSVQKTKRNLMVNGGQNVISQKPLLKMTSKAVHKLSDDDYDGGFPNGSKRTKGDEDSSDESESSSEYTGFIRNARSPWNIGTYVDKLGEKSTAIMSRILSFLPLFPQITQKRKTADIDSNH